MNDLSVFDGDAERDRQIVDLRVKGKSEAEVVAMLGVTVPDIHRALDRAAAQAMTPQARIRSIYVDWQRMERIQGVFLPLAEGGDGAAAHVVIRAQERSATLTGANAPLRTDPIALALEVGPSLTSTQSLRQVINEMRARDPKRRMNGGEGYGDERDLEDEKLIKMRDANDFVGEK